VPPDSESAELASVEPALAASVSELAEPDSVPDSVPEPEPEPEPELAQPELEPAELEPETVLVPVASEHGTPNYDDDIMGEPFSPVLGIDLRGEMSHAGTQGELPSPIVVPAVAVLLPLTTATMTVAQTLLGATHTASAVTVALLPLVATTLEPLLALAVPTDLHTRSFQTIAKFYEYINMFCRGQLSAGDALNEVGWAVTKASSHLDNSATFICVCGRKSIVTTATINPVSPRKRGRRSVYSACTFEIKGKRGMGGGDLTFAISGEHNHPALLPEAMPTLRRPMKSEMTPELITCVRTVTNLIPNIQETIFQETGCFIIPKGVYNMRDKVMICAIIIMILSIFYHI